MSPRPGLSTPLRAAVLAALLAVTVAGAGLAQEREITVSFSGMNPVDASTAQAVVTVLDEQNRPAPGLTASDLNVTLDGMPLPVTSVERAVDSELPIGVVLAIDVSGSMNEGDALAQAIASAQQFVAGLGPDDEVAIVTFGSTVERLLPFTTDKDAARVAIEALVAEGATALYQGTAEAAQLSASAESSRRAIVLLSDGRDHGSAITEDDVLSAVQQLGVPIFAIGLGTDIERAYLQQLADGTGGQFTGTPNAEGLSDLYQTVGEQLRGQYVLTLDVSGLAAPDEPGTLRVEATVDGLLGGDERLVCPQQVCVTLRQLTPDERIESSRTVVADVLASDPVASVAFLVDGAVLQEVTETPYTFELDPDLVEDGDHTLAVVAVTQAGDRATREVPIRTGAAGSGTYVVVLIAIPVAALVVGGLFLIFRRFRRPRVDPAERIKPKIKPDESATRTIPESWLPDNADLPPVRIDDEPAGRVHIVAGPQTGQAYEVGSAPISIGSGPRCLVRLSEETDSEERIAKEHARIWIRDGQLMVHEVRRLTVMGVEGGRWLIMEHGETFSVGSYTLRFELLDGEVPQRHDEDAGQASPVPDILRPREPSAAQPANGGLPSDAPGPSVPGQSLESAPDVTANPVESDPQVDSPQRDHEADDDGGAGTNGTGERDGSRASAGNAESTPPSDTDLPYC